MTSRVIVSALAAVGLTILVVYYFWTRDSNLWPSVVATVFGLFVGLMLVYQIVEKKINEERRARLKAVEQVVLDGVLAYSIAVVRRIGMFAGVRDLEPQLNENDSELVKKAESFAKRVISEGLPLSNRPLQIEAARSFLRETDDMLNGLFMLQGQYPFVFEEYPEIARTLIDLRVASNSVKSAFYWYGAGSSINSEEHRTLVEQSLTKLVKACDKSAESVSRSLKGLRS